MIVRESEDGFVLIRQHDHGLVSGEFAKHFSPEFVGALSEEVVSAIASHDRAWLKPDSEILWNEAADRPYSFLDHPPEPKTTAYTHFLDEMAAESPYGALLCSAHYGALVEGSEDPYELRFASHERERRGRIRGKLSDDAPGDFERDFAALRFSDDLSLFVCLNEPGKNEYPWYRDGLKFLGERITPVWKSADVLGFDTSPFREEFGIAVPYRVLGRDRRENESGSYRILVAT